MEMFDQITETRIEPDGKVTVTNVPAEEVENAVADFVWSVREFGPQLARGHRDRPERRNPVVEGA